MLGRIVSVCVCVALWLPVSPAAEAKVQKLTFGSGGVTRSYSDGSDPRHGAAKNPDGAIWVGTNDNFFPLKVVRNTRDVLNARGFNTQLTEIRNHTHDYYSSSSSINKEVWTFLQQHKLAADPKFQAYQLNR